MVEEPKLSGRTLEHLQAEADLLYARELFAYAERYLAEAVLLRVILSSLNDNYHDHSRYLSGCVHDADRDVSIARVEVDKATSRLRDAETNWAEVER